MPRGGCETSGAGVLSGGSDHESAAVSLDVGSSEGLNPNGDPNDLSQGWRGAFNRHLKQQTSPAHDGNRKCDILWRRHCACTTRCDLALCRR